MRQLFLERKMSYFARKVGENRGGTRRNPQKIDSKPLFLLHKPSSYLIPCVKIGCLNLVF